ncbi:MAG: MCE family protein [bacterium]|nr:MCE family protein [bacterium]
MNFKFKHAEKIVGIFVLVALIILVSTVIVIAISHKMFVTTHPYYTKLSEATGLSSSTPLNFKGYNIGRVKSFKLDRENNIDVELAIYSEYKEKILKGCAIYRQSNPITGETSLVLLLPRFSDVSSTARRRGFGDFPQPEGSYIPSLDMPDGQRLVENDLVEMSGDSVTILFDDAKMFFSNLRNEFQLKKDSFKDFFQKLADVSDSLVRNRAIFDHLHRLLNPEGGPVFETVERFAQMSKRLQIAVDRMDQMLENYKDPDGLMLKMLKMDRSKLEEMFQNLNNNLLALQKMLEGLTEQSPLMAEVLEKTRKTLEAVNNNPFLRGGISKEGKSSNSSRKKRLDIEEKK